MTNLDNVVSYSLGALLTVALLGENNLKVKIKVANFVNFIWLLYSIYYKDYKVVAVCLVIFIHLSQKDSTR
jgi:hypothetical protein